MANTLKFGNGEWYGKKDTILAYNDENDNYKPLLFDFSRNSSGTVVNKDGLIETVGNGEPRIDFKDNTKGSLLLEPSRMNVILHSQDFSNNAWNTSSTRSVDFAPTSTTDPEGKTNAYRITSTASNNQVAVFGSIISGQVYTNSIYVRRVSGSGNIILRDVNNQGNNFQVSVSDGWKRIETTATSTSIFGRLYINLYTIGDVIEIWGGQVEQGSYATSYIPTSGSAVTRVADTNVSQNTPSGIIGQTEGSVFINVDVNSKVLSSSWAFSLNDGTTSNYIGLRRSGGAEFFVHINVSGTTTALIATGITSGNNKISIGYKFNDIVVYVNGVNVGIDTSSGVPLTNKVQIGNLISNRILEDSVSDFKLYNTRLSNAELQALTQ